MQNNAAQSSERDRRRGCCRRYIRTRSGAGAAVWLTRKERYHDINHDKRPDEDEDEDEYDEQPRVAIAGLRSSCFPVDAGWHPMKSSFGYASIATHIQSSSAS